MRIVNNTLNWGKHNRSTSYIDEDQQRSCTNDRMNNVAKSRNVDIQTEGNEEISAESQTNEGFYPVKQFKTKDDVIHFFSLAKST